MLVGSKHKKTETERNQAKNDRRRLVFGFFLWAPKLLTNIQQNITNLCFETCGDYYGNMIGPV